jgi:hypothetical protein
VAGGLAEGNHAILFSWAATKKPIKNRLVPDRFMAFH